MVHGAGVGLAEAVLHGDLEGQGIGAGPGAVEGRRELFFIFDDDAGFQIVGGIGQRHVAAIVADPGPVVEAGLFNAHILQIIGKIFPGNGLFAVKNRINTAAQGVIFDDPVVVPQFLVHAVGAQEPIGGLGFVVLIVGADVANGVGGNRRILGGVLGNLSQLHHSGGAAVGVEIAVLKARRLQFGDTVLSGHVENLRLAVQFPLAQALSQRRKARHTQSEQNDQNGHHHNGLHQGKPPLVGCSFHGTHLVFIRNTQNRQHFSSLPVCVCSYFFNS